MQSRTLPIDSDFVLELDDERYFVQTSTKTEGIGGRKWKTVLTTVQGAPSADDEIPLPSFHEGAGFTWAGMPGVYEHAGANSSGSSAGCGWDASAPGRLASWQRHAVGSDLVTTTTTRGWLKQLGAFLYMGRGRYVRKYAIDATLGSTWAASGADRDLGAANVVAGRMASWSGKLYVASKNASTDALQTFTQITQGSPDTYASGPAGKEARSFFTYRSLLGRTQANGIATCAVTPTTASNWSDDGGNGLYEVGNPSVNATDALEWQLYIYVAKDDGVWSFAEDFYTRNEFIGLSNAIVTDNCRPLATAGNDILIPHSAGLIGWLPGEAWDYVGPEREGAYETDKSPGIGKVSGIVARGRDTYIAYQDTVNGRSSIVMIRPGHENRPVVPHMHFEALSGYFEDLAIVTDTAGVEYLAAIHTSADRLTARPWIWRLPRAGLSASQDSAVPKAVSNTSFFTPRYYGPQRNLQKTYREWEFWLEATAADLANTPGIEVWARVDDGAAFQLNGADGLAANITTEGAQRLLFPPTAAAVGHYVQLEYRVPAIAGGETAIAIDALRDQVLRLSYRPRVGPAIQATLVLCEGEFDDHSGQQLTVEQQLENLTLLTGPTAEVTPYKDPFTGEYRYCSVEITQITEAQFKGQSDGAYLVDVVLRDQAYT